MDGSPSSQVEPASGDEIRALTKRLAVPRPDCGDAERLELVRALEDLTRSAAAAHAVLSDEFDRSQRARQEAEGVPAARVGTGVADDLALAGKVSPARSSNRLTCSRALTREMPQTLAALREGVIDAHQAEVVTRATACLSVEDRSLVDERLAGRLSGLSTKQLRDAVTALVYDLDPQAHVRRAARAAEDAYVAMRPAPDVMCVISAMLPAAQGVAVHAALKKHAEGLRASGDPRSQGKIMADTLYANVTGRDPVTLPDIDLSLVMTDASLMAGDTVAAFLDGYGPVPAQSARDLMTPRRAVDTGELASTSDPAHGVPSSSAEAEPQTPAARETSSADRAGTGGSGGTCRVPCGGALRPLGLRPVARSGGAASPSERISHRRLAHPRSGRTPRGAGLRPAAVRRPGDRRGLRPRLTPTLLQRRPARASDQPRPLLPHPVVRGSDPAHRPPGAPP
ncbi:DUF222 domain-containing protein [Serinicoccus marinus]|uniref:DUF222 domain-containing protein n=1 Tax=Serinicoccus marinus TaxID=247333 RepID=UPI0013756736|nr:DUF222 domain-containing protein [Serinicoccus marinus]